jgi:hypothetical protein
MLWLEGKSIVDMYTSEKEGLQSAIHAAPGQFDKASCNPLMLFRHTPDADFAILGRVGRHASCGILMPPSFCGFPHIVLRRGRVACLHYSRSPESFLSYPAWVQREYADQEQLALLWHWLAGRLQMAAKSNETDSKRHSKPPLPRVMAFGRAGEGLGRVQ